MGRGKVKVSTDTNVLVRAVVQDDPKQGAAAARLLREAETLAVSLVCLCEFVWVLRRVYGMTRTAIGEAVEVLPAAASVVTNRPEVEAGLAVLAAGGDFADGAIA